MQATDMIIVTVAGRSQVVQASKALDTAAEMGANAENKPSFEQTVVVNLDKPAPAAGEMNETGRERSEQDKAAVITAGYTPAETVYARGSQVNETGVANAKAARAEFEAMPLAVDECDRVEREVIAEHRVDLPAVDTNSLRMTDVGALAVHGQRLAVSERALRGLVSRLGCGGADYLLTKCDPKLRAINFNHQAVALAAREDLEIANAHAERATTPSYKRTVVVESDYRSQAKVRARINGGQPQAFAVVSPSYSAFDADKLARIVGECIPREARGEASYDGERVRFEALLHSTVQPENFVAGEFFRAGIVCDSDDTGAGGIRIRGVVHQNLCLNLIILDEAWQDFGRIIHKGRGLESRVRSAVNAASASLRHFREVWGTACETDVVTDAQLALGREIAASAIFRGILTRELVKLPGKLENNTAMLYDALQGDRSSATVKGTLSKASVVNAFTRVAHTSGFDPWQADEISASATGLLLRKQALPFELAE